MPDFNQDHFSLFGLQPGFAIDAERLDAAYRALQTEVHPDRYAHAGDAEQRLAMQWTTRVNEAYQTLKRPFERACYLLKQHGIDVLDANNTALPADFLMQQMEWREDLARGVAAGDFAALQALEDGARAAAKAQLSTIAALLDDAHDYPAAAESLRQYRFLDKFLADVAAAYEDID